jgi:hypothetical protein
VKIIYEADNIICPKCGNNTRIIKTIDKKNFVVRYRKCTNKRCNNKFNTKEITFTEWNYKRTLEKIKDILREVK